MIVEAFDLRDVFPFLLNDIGISTYCREVMNMTQSLALLALKILLVVLVFFANLALVGRRLLVLANRYISRMSINKFSSFKVFLFHFC